MTAVADERVIRVVDGLVEIFLAEGFAHLGVAELARRLSCSKSTLYAVAPSKEQIVLTAVRAFFRGATARVEQSAAVAGTARDRLEAYLQAISTELRPASPAFIADVEAFAPAREIYRRNTQAAARRVRELVTEAPTVGASLDATFVGAVAALVMESVQRGDLTRTTGLDDSQAYAALTDLLVAGLR
ncbi:TetR/AcrR family transcriptional regulator [Solicola sp. PLA-1-18]|uniref:TetR/AcrR family transcriptional regulator n=1 Tax=Solicola sp. PLA-1-18 TaxID=3380532 RepID=UPI003B791EB8